MLAFFSFFLLLFGITLIVALRLKAFLWTVAIAILLLLATCFSSIHWFFLTIVWLFFLIASLFAHLPFLRRRLFTIPILKLLTPNLPKISETERQTIEAGDVWWEKELFSGLPNWKQFQQMPLSSLTKAEQDFLDGPVDTLCEMLNDWEITESKGDLPKKIWRFLKEKRFFALEIEEKWGGLGFSALAHSTIVMKIASRSPSAAVTMMVPNSLGPAELIKRYGTQAQQEHYLPRLAKGEEIPCFGLTGTDAGSDATAMSDTGIVCQAKYEGKEQLCIRLNFNKRYITLAPLATLIGLAFKLYDPDHLLGEKENIGITLALLPAKHAGVEIGSHHKPMRMTFMNGPIRGKDVIIPVDWIIGGKDKCGKGWEMLMEALAVGRGISLPALATGNAKLAFCTTGAYAYLRKQFNLSIGQFEGIQEVLGRIGGMAYMCEAVRLFTLSAIDDGLKPALASAITKYHLTEFGRQIGNDAMDIHGGRAIQRGPRNYLANLYDSIPISITVEGANILTRNLIIFGQGLIRSHPYLQKEVEAANMESTQLRIKTFDELLYQHTGFFLSNLARTCLFALGGSYFTKTPFTGKIAKYAKSIIKMSTALAVVSDCTLMLLGGKLKMKEALSARLGDVLSHLYMASALLKYYQRQTPTKEQEIALRWCMHFCFYAIQTAFNGFFANFPNHCLAHLLKHLIFPFGNCYKPPSDTENKALSMTMMQLNPLREEIKMHCYLKTMENDPVGRVESAFHACLLAEPFNEKLKLAIKKGEISAKYQLDEQIKKAITLNILDEKEADLIKEAEKKRTDSMKVDEFK